MRGGRGIFYLILLAEILLTVSLRFLAIGTIFGPTHVETVSLSNGSQEASPLTWTQAPSKWLELQGVTVSLGVSLNRQVEMLFVRHERRQAA